MFPTVPPFMLAQLVGALDKLSDYELAGLVRDAYENAPDDATRDAMHRVAQVAHDALVGGVRG